MASNKALLLQKQLKEHNKAVQETETETKYRELSQARGAHTAAASAPEPMAVCASNRYLVTPKASNSARPRTTDQESIREAYTRMLSGSATSTMQSLAKRMRT